MAIGPCIFRKVAVGPNKFRKVAVGHSNLRKVAVGPNNLRTVAAGPSNFRKASVGLINFRKVSVGDYRLAVITSSENTVLTYYTHHTNGQVIEYIDQSGAPLPLVAWVHRICTV